MCPAHVNAKRVLDVGCGTGIWAIEFGTFMNIRALMSLAHAAVADEHPDAEVLAVDRIPMSPEWLACSSFIPCLLF